jgi:phage antirepressor YoqD-like protein
MTIINESGLFSTILRSDKPNAARFRNWVTHEVLPSIKRDGYYSMPGIEGGISPDSVAVQMLYRVLEAQKEMMSTFQSVLDMMVQSQTPKRAQSSRTDLPSISTAGFSYRDIIEASVRDVNVTALATDYGLAAPTFNQLLRTCGIQDKHDDTWLLCPEYTGQGYTTSRLHTHRNWDGKMIAVTYTRWTKKGRLFLYEKLKAQGILPTIEKTATNAH